MDVQVLAKQLEIDEARRRFPYLDCCGRQWQQCTCKTKGKLTIGIGRNLDDVGLFDDEINYLLQGDIKRASAELDRQLPWWQHATEAVQQVLANMSFNMGIARLLGFRNTLADIQAGRYKEAAGRMKQSLWRQQTGPRADRIIKILEDQ